MEHRWGRRLVTTIPVRLRCVQSPDSGCRCLGRVENISASGALIKTELGIRPSTTIAVETLSTALGRKSCELRACIVRDSPGEIAVEWTDSPTEVFGVLTEIMLSGNAASESERPALGRVRFCALSSATLAYNRYGLDTSPTSHLPATVRMMAQAHRSFRDDALRLLTIPERL